MRLPYFGDDLFRAMAVLPGVIFNDFSARFNVRGELHDEVLVHQALRTALSKPTN